MGRPAMLRSTFLFIRVDWSRAGMIPATRNVLMQASLTERACLVHPRGHRDKGMRERTERL